jgi:hypothetical protein
MEATKWLKPSISVSRIGDSRFEGRLDAMPVDTNRLARSVVNGPAFAGNISG